MRKLKVIKASISETIEILGHKVDGYKAILNAVEVTSTPGSTIIDGRGREVVFDNPYISFDNPSSCIPGLHILNVYERYPCFDSSDFAYEDRFYENFFFSNKPFTRDQITRIAFIKHVGCLNFLYDEIPRWALPSAYYRGEGDEIIYAF